MIALKCARLLCGVLLVLGTHLMAQDATATINPPPPIDPVHIRVYETDSTAYPEIKVYFSALNRQNGRILLITSDNIEATLGETSDLAVPITVETLESRPNTSRRLNLVLCFDLTSSNTDDFLQQQKNTAFDLIDQLDVNDAVAIVAQSDHGAEVRFSLQADHGGARNAIDELEIVRGSSNAFLDGVNAAVAVLNGVQETNSRNAVVIMTDVTEPQGTIPASQTILLANQLNTPLYMIGYNDARPQILDEFSNATNGFTYLQRGPDETFDRLTKDITEFLNQEYAATLHASLPAENKTYQLGLTVDVSGDSFTIDVPGVTATARPLTLTFPLIEEGQTFSDEIRFEPHITYADGSAVQGIEVSYTLERSPNTRQPTPLTTGSTQNRDFTWDLRGKVGGDYEVKVLVVDEYGNQGEQTVRFVVASPLRVEFVDPVNATQPITAATYFPQADAQLVMQVQGSYGLSSLILRLNDAPLGTPQALDQVLTTAEVDGSEQSALYDYIWDTSSLAPGHYTLSVEAVDNRGNSAAQILDASISLSPEDPTNIFIFVVIIVILVIFLVSLTLVRRATQRPTLTPVPPPLSTPPMMPATMAPRPRASLTVVKNGLPGRNEYVLMDKNYIVGRGDNVDIQVFGLGASRTHAELRWDGMAFTWVELTPEKKNPALINGSPVIQRHVMQHGDQIQLGDTIFQFRMI